MIEYISLTELHLFLISTVTNSCGLVIISQASQERSSFLSDTDLRLEVEEAKRRRHRSAGEGQNKPSRSMSLFAGWRSPRHNNTASGSNDAEEGSKVTFRYSDLIKNEDGNASLSHEANSVKSSDCASGDNTNINMYYMSDMQPAVQNEAHVSKSMGAICPPLHPDSDKLQTVPSVTISDSNISSHAPSTPTSGRKAKVIPESDSVVGDTNTDSKEKKELSSIIKTVPDKSCSTPNHSIVIQAENGQAAHSSIDSGALSENNSEVTASSNSQQSSSIKSGYNVNDNTITSTDRSDLRRSVSISDDKLSGQFNEVSVNPSLGEPDCTLSSSGGDMPAGHTAPSKQVEEDSESINSLTDTKKERPTDFMFRRTQSLRKTNEAIGSYLKWASKAAFTKLNELKQTITTPLKNGSLGSLGSLSSLTHSVEELDANDASSNSGTLRERLRHGGSQDILSHSEESETDEANKRLSGLSFGELDFCVLFIFYISLFCIKYSQLMTLY